jgi:hypothetical protein
MKPWPPCGSAECIADWFAGKRWFHTPDGRGSLGSSTYAARLRHAFHQPETQITSAEFNAALREAGFGVDHGRIVDVSGRCPGFATLPSFNKGAVNRNATLAKIIRERNAEIERRDVASERPA